MIKPSVDRKIVEVFSGAGVDTLLSVPCNMLGGILKELPGSAIRHLPVCREEEGVGIAAGAALAGKRPLLLMQNSGLGNCVNALMSLTGLYELPLFMLMSKRGGPDEKVSAQVPMGRTAPLLLDAMGIGWQTVGKKQDLADLQKMIRRTYTDGRMRAAFLMRELWNETR